MQVEEGVVNMRIRYRPNLLSSFHEDYWTCTLTQLFFRGDCRERYDVPGHGRQLRGQQWAKVLLKRVDFRGWRLSKEFAAMAHNVDLRRRQMWGVYSHIASPHTSFRRDVNAIDTLEARDLVHVALAAGECRSIREALRKKNVDTKVKSVLRTMKLALRNVPGSEGERDYL